MRYAGREARALSRLRLLNSMAEGARLTSILVPDRRKPTRYRRRYSLLWPDGRPLQVNVDPGSVESALEDLEIQVRGGSAGTAGGQAAYELTRLGWSAVGRTPPAT